jgi:hypothetical protein
VFWQNGRYQDNGTYLRDDNAECSMWNIIARPMIPLSSLKYDELWCSLILWCVGGGGRFTCVCERCAQSIHIDITTFYEVSMCWKNAKSSVWRQVNVRIGVERRCWYRCNQHNKPSQNICISHVISLIVINLITINNVSATNSKTNPG